MKYSNLIGSQMSIRRKMNKTCGVLCSFRLKLREVYWNTMFGRELTIWIFLFARNESYFLTWLTHFRFLVGVFCRVFFPWSTRDQWISGESHFNIS